MPGESPVIQSILGAEFGATSTTAAEAQGKAAQLFQLNQSRQSINPAPASAADSRDLSSRLGSGLQKAINGVLEASTGLAAARTTKPGLDEAGGLLVDPVTKEAPRLSNSAERVQAGVEAIGAAEQFRREADKSDLNKNYRDVVHGMLVMAAIRAASSTVDSYTPDMVNDSTVKAMVSQILGNGNKNIPTAIAATLGTYTKQDLSDAPAAVVADVIAQYVNARKISALSTLDSQMQTFMDTTGNGVVKKVNDIETQLDKSTQAMTDLSNALSTETAVLSSQSPVSVDVSADLVVMTPDANSLWGQLSPNDKLTALDEGILSTQVDTSKLQPSLLKSSAVLNARDRALGALQAVDELGNLAASLGVPVDTYNLSKNVDTATTAINVAASIASGNWVGALSAGAGLIGGPAPDPTQLALGAISKQLDQVIGLQKQTLEKLDMLANQLEASTERILTSMDDVKRLVGDVLYFEEESAATGFLACEKFVTKAVDFYGMSDGIFPSFQKRGDHLHVEDGMEDAYKTCVGYLDGDVKDVGQRETKAGPTFLSTIFLAYAPNQKIDSDGYQNMLHHTMHLLGIPSLTAKPNCVTRMAWAASLGARYFSDLNVNELSCGSLGDADIASSALHCDGSNLGIANQECKKLRLTTVNVGSPILPVDAVAALQNSVVPENVQEIGEILLFIAPYLSITKLRGNDWVVLSPAELANGKLEQPTHARPPNRRIYLWPNSFLNVANIAVAQQSVSSGSLITEATLQLLEKVRYGAAATFPPRADPNNPNAPPPPDPLAVTDAAKAAMTAYNPKSNSSHSILDGFPEPYNYVATVWLLQSNPTYAANFMRYLVTKRLAANNVKRPEYQFAMRTENINFIADMLRDPRTGVAPPLQFLHGEDGGRKGWHIVLSQQDGSVVYLPLPPSTVIWANAIAYPSPAYSLFTLRQALLERSILAQPDIQTSLKNIDPAAPRLVTLEALGDKQLGESKMTLSLYYTRQCRARVCRIDNGTCDTPTAGGRVCVGE